MQVEAVLERLGKQWTKIRRRHQLLMDWLELVSAFPSMAEAVQSQVQGHFGSEPRLVVHD